MALNLWDSSGSNITTDISTQATTGFVAGEHIISGDFNRILRETSLITSVLAAFIQTKTTHEISYDTSVANATSWLTSALTAPGANISGGSAGQLLYQTADSTTGKVAVATTNGALLKYNTSTNTPYWDNTCTAANADTVDNWHIAKVDTLPATPDANTIYLKKVTT